MNWEDVTQAEKECKDYVERKAVFLWIKKYYSKDKLFINSIITAIPKADVQEVKHGKWKYDSEDVGYANCLCSECDNFLTFDEDDEGIDLYPYCPYCGAKMDKE